MVLQTRDPQNDSSFTSTSDTMSLREIADGLDISMTTAYEKARQDALPVPAIRVGRQFRFSRKAYDALMNAQHSTERGGDSQAA